MLASAVRHAPASSTGTVPLTRLDIQAQPNDPTQPLPWAQHADEYDIKEDDPTVTSTPPGIVLRTDYSTGSDDAWTAFCSALQDTERDFFADQTPPTPVATPPTDNDNDSDDSDDASSTDDEPSLVLFALLSDGAYCNISNIRASSSTF